ncbi:MAG: nitrate reductase associated protein [Synechococcales cyanobacterium K44_A2020_017]|mgnify:CR=1 FL=1|nr:nitrate reductase associated protein [Synechococcales cyanobacterium K32_A2020_035]MBF2096025.1 nitrate reductase associated protein [Synechococcales cyanobacterium K44_A2020_017]
MMTFFQFEADFVESLRCIPMQIRYKLDTCGVKLKLTHWHHLSQGDRQTLLELPCESLAEVDHYRQALQQMITQATGQPAGELPCDPAPPWLDAHRMPDSVQTKADECQVAIALSQWADLTPLQRFALIKLSRSGHENRNFVPALQEFGVL